MSGALLVLNLKLLGVPKAHRIQLRKLLFESWSSWTITLGGRPGCYRTAASLIRCTAGFLRALLNYNCQALRAKEQILFMNPIQRLRLSRLPQRYADCETTMPHHTPQDLLDLHAPALGKNVQALRANRVGSAFADASTRRSSNDRPRLSKAQVSGIVVRACLSVPGASHQGRLYPYTELVQINHIWTEPREGEPARVFLWAPVCAPKLDPNTY